MDGATLAFTFDGELFTPDAAKAWLAHRGYKTDLTPTQDGLALRADQLDFDTYQSGTLETVPVEDGLTALVGDVKDGAADVFHRSGFVDVPDENMTSRFVVSTADPDAYGDVVEQKGIRLDQYKRNPVVLFGHDPEKVIGRASNVRLNGNGDLAADFTFADSSQGVLGELGESVARMIKAGFLNAASIGFTSDNREPIRDKKGNITGIRFKRSTLKEISVVAIPANQEALVAARSFGISERVARELVQPVGKTPTRDSFARRVALKKRALAHIK